MGGASLTRKASEVDKIYTSIIIIINDIININVFTGRLNFLENRFCYFENEWEAFLTSNDMYNSLILSEAASSRHRNHLEELQATLKSGGI